MSDPRFLQDGFENCLSHLIEECGEMLAAAGKTQRWGLYSVNPLLPENERESNLVWLRREMCDLRDALDRLDSELFADEVARSQPARKEAVTRDEHRAECLEAMKAAGRAAVDNADFENLIERIFDSLHGIAFVNPIEATNYMLENGARAISSETNWSDAMSCWNAMAPAGDLTNQPEEKP